MKEVTPVELALLNLADYREGYEWFCKENPDEIKAVVEEIKLMVKGESHHAHIIGKLANITVARMLLDQQKEGGCT